MVVTNNRIKVKFFIGCHLTPDIEMKLNQNLDWKQSRIGTDQSSPVLSEVYFQDRKYLGLFLDKPMATLSELKSLEKEIRDLLAKYCSELPIDSLKLYIFSQVFIN
jgi:hypothetical protein